jgi:catechol 2,3-dioxygenase-like lactoylglutathione lyase family enzyme
MNMKLEVIIIPVSDTDRAKAFYTKLGFRLDGDFVVDENLRVLQFTPPRSEASIIFGKGVTSAKPGSIKGSSWPSTTSNISCHAGQRTRAREHLQDEGVRADKRSIAPRGRDIACIHVPQQSALLRRSAHTVPLQL